MAESHSSPALVDRSLHVAIVGAGAFGGWTALSLLGRGARVTLFDAWGPGNPRASSGGESRGIRGMYGVDRPLLRDLAGGRGALGDPALSPDRLPLDVRGRRRLRPRLPAAPRGRGAPRRGARRGRGRAALATDRPRRHPHPLPRGAGGLPPRPARLPDGG